MSLHQILLEPSDVLFFRDGRPMGGSLAGHTAAWPLPDVTNHALHAALHRAGLDEVHAHRRGRSGVYSDERDRKFGSLQTVGPFPVEVGQQVAWYFPRPKDAAEKSNTSVTLKPYLDANGKSSLPHPLQFAVANTQPPSKDAGGEPWISKQAFEAYLEEGDFKPENGKVHFLNDSDLADTEYSIGIEIDPSSGTTGQGDTQGKLYSAHYLRLRDKIRLGLIAQSMDKGINSSDPKIDLIEKLLNGHSQSIVVGGQQRICSAKRESVSDQLPLPVGIKDGFKTVAKEGKTRWLVKWILLSPAIWPEIHANESKKIRAHHGGWLPNWICPQTGSVLLKAGDTERQNGEGRELWRKRVRRLPNIAAQLVSAIVPKPIPVTGWALPNEVGREEGGAKSTHLAVPARAVYYFETDSEEDAKKLAAALNWHGNTDGTEIKNRRSTLLGEKGYGLGVCGTWDFYKGNSQS